MMHARGKIRRGTRGITIREEREAFTAEGILPKMEYVMR